MAMGIGNRYSQHSFAKAPEANIQRSQFDRSHTIKDTLQFDELTPIFCDEVIPGDTANVSVNMFARLATQIVPIMDNMYLDFFFFFVPNRLVWSNWERFMGAQDNPGDSTAYLVPQISPAANFPVGGLHDKFGLPTGIATAALGVNALPLRAYAKIWNAWFRDENLQTRVAEYTGDGPDVANGTILKRGKRHDYFTSALPWPQKGTAVPIPVGTAPNQIVRQLNAPAWTAYLQNTNTLSGGGTVSIDGSGGINNGTTRISMDPNGGLQLSANALGTINMLREAFAIQSLFEADARGGTRYVEILQQHYGVTSPDFRLQRPEYLGGGSVMFNSHPVAQTSPTSGSAPLGQLGSFATASTQGGRVGFTKSFVEHGYIIGMVCPRADITYQQGVNKMWTRRTRFDFFFPKLQELGEQAILNKEIYYTNSATDDQVFGYQERYAEYRYKPSEIHGQFRSTYATPLDQWHMAEKFASLPALNNIFITQNTPIDRAIAVTNAPHVLMDLWFNYKHARPMVAYAVPASLGRF